MSNLLINEAPMQVLPSLATKIGLNEAIVLQQFHYWLSKSNNKKDGYVWIYNSYDNWLEQFNFFSKSTLKRAIKSLERQELIIIGNYNKAGFDKTKWYRIDYENLEKLEDEPVVSRGGQNDLTKRSKRTDGRGQNEPMEEVNMNSPIPLDYQETTRDYDKRLGNSKNQSKPYQKTFYTWENNWGFPNAIMRENLTEWVDLFGDDLVEYVLKLTAEKGIQTKGASGYVKAIFNSYQEKGIKTLEDAQQEAENHKNVTRKNYGNYKQNNIKENVPGWAESDQYQPPKQSKKEVDIDKLNERLLARRKSSADN